MPFFERGYSGGYGSLTLGVPSGGGSFYDVAGQIDPGTLDPFRGPEQFDSEYTGKSGWEDVWKTLAIGAGQAVIAKTLYKPTDRGSGNRTELLKAVEPNKKPPFNDSASGTSSVFSNLVGGNTGLLIGVSAVAIILILLIAKRG